MKNMNRFKLMRLKSGMSQDELAIKVGLDHSTICKIELGYYKTTEKNKKKLANALDVMIEELFSKKPLTEDEAKIILGI